MEKLRNYKDLKDLTGLKPQVIAKALFRCCKYYLSLDELGPYLEEEMCKREQQ